MCKLCKLCWSCARWLWIRLGQTVRFTICRLLFDCSRLLPENEEVSDRSSAITTFVVFSCELRRCLSRSRHCVSFRAIPLPAEARCSDAHLDSSLRELLSPHVSSVSFKLAVWRPTLLVSESIDLFLLSSNEARVASLPDGKLGNNLQVMSTGPRSRSAFSSETTAMLSIDSVCWPKLGALGFGRLSRLLAPSPRAAAGETI